jgi:hypothetical protein
MPPVFTGGKLASYRAVVLRRKVSQTVSLLSDALQPTLQQPTFIAGAAQALSQQ